MYEKYAHRGLEIIGMPSNDFRREPMNDEQIDFLIKRDYGLKFKMLSKDHVNGENTSELYRWLRQNSDLYQKKSGKCKKIFWNYEKFLIDRHGKIFKRYDRDTMPEEIQPDIMKLLEY